MLSGPGGGSSDSTAPPRVTDGESPACGCHQLFQPLVLWLAECPDGEETMCPLL
ncbi:hypothetical protein DNTS_002003 [Danionella cerebrum]|uniref:Uncharacterized protein n=1 Tax=Danionella cerebrum TaxID=2873325 RepID=A0A553RB17_9TELE|nr:hypothetical protein DNTS_002003 [Danionella translucida]